MADFHPRLDAPSDVEEDASIPNLPTDQSVTDMTETDDGDYDPAADTEVANDAAYLESLLAAHDAIEDLNEDDDEDEGDEEDEEDGPYAEVEIQIEDDGNEDEADADAERTLQQERHIIRLLQSTNYRRLLIAVDRGDFVLHRLDDDDDEDDDADFNPMWGRRRRRPTLDPNRFPKAPSDKGTELMNSGRFGSNEVQTVSSGDRNGTGKKKKLARRILDRELATESHAKQKVNQRLMAQGMIPSSNADMIIHYDQPVYSGQFSDDGNFFYSVNKDYHVRMYDTSNPYKWRYYKTVAYPFGSWTLTDASLSPDKQYLAYTSIKSTVCLAPTDPHDLGDPYILDLADMGHGRPQVHAMARSRFGGSFGIWSVRFSGDGRELVAGTSGGSIVVYDIESRRSTHRIFGHDDDVNAVCFADSGSPHILYSGSDDTTIKVWDTRSMGDSRAAGAFIGHIEGLTYIDSKGDGRYVLSNGKDQSMKLWDLRMVMSPRDYERIKPLRRVAREPRFDYRSRSYDEDDWYQDEHDNSIVTFRGHKVLRTLIRCHFSPPGSTNSRYVYSGSEDGKVYVWNMDATLAGTVDVFSATENTRPPHSQYDMMMGWDDDDVSHSTWKTCVRDASWHPNAPVIAASAWNGYGMSTGTTTVHSWNDGAEDDEAEPKMGLRVNGRLEYGEDFYRTPEQRTPAGRSARLRALRSRWMR